MRPQQASAHLELPHTTVAPWLLGVVGFALSCSRRSFHMHSLLLTSGPILTRTLVNNTCDAPTYFARWHTSQTGSQTLQPSESLFLFQELAESITGTAGTVFRNLNPPCLLSRKIMHFSFGFGLRVGIQRWRVFCEFQWSPFPRKDSTKTPRKFGEASEQHSGNFHSAIFLTLQLTSRRTARTNNQNHSNCSAPKP